MKNLFTVVCGNKRDVMWGMLNVIIISVSVYVINMGEYHQYTVVAKQAFYAFFIGSSMVRIARYVARWVIRHYYIPDGLALWCGVVSAWTVNLVFNIVLHSVEGTPDPLTTIVVVSVLTFAGLVFTGYFEIKKIRQEKKDKI